MSKELTTIDALKRDINSLGPQFKAALPAHIPHEKFVRVLMTALSQNPALAQADRNSLFAACMTAAQQVLLPDGREGAIVTFRTKDGVKAQFLSMLAGVLKKIRNSGELQSISAQMIYKNDKFKYWVDSDGEHLEHEPNLFSDRGEPLGVYAIAKTKDGGVYIEVLTNKQINDVRNVSKSKDSGPWAGAFAEEMAKKSALRRLSKRLPMSTDIDRDLSDDDDYAQPVVQDEAPVQAAPVVEKKSRLDNIIDVSNSMEPQAEQAPVDLPL